MLKSLRSGTMPIFALSIAALAAGAVSTPAAGQQANYDPNELRESVDRGTVMI